MPSVSAKQQRFMGADYARAKAGKKTKTGMSKGQLKDFASSNPGSQANRGGSKPHGGFEPKSVGQARQRVGVASADTAWQGGPPAEGFHRPSAPAGTAVPSKHKAYEHLGRFKTGKPRKGVGNKNTSVPSQANC
jgi:hypothetical protein